MNEQQHTHLSRRERQIVDILYGLGRGSAAEVRERLPDPPSYSAVRALLAKLEDKGHIRHQEDGRRYLYSVVIPRTKARQSALERLVHTFFGGSAANAATSLLGNTADEMSVEELDQLAEMIEQAKKRHSEDKTEEHEA